MGDDREGLSRKNMLILGLAEFSLKMFSLRSAENHGEAQTKYLPEQKKKGTKAQCGWNLHET